ncbi:MAG: hypothetical protein ABIO82_00310, partial [Ginsengibacter sp.]
MLLQGTLVLDQNKDTLLYAGSVKVNITDWFFFKEKIRLGYAGLDNAVLYLNRKDSVWNYQFLVDYFSGPSKPKKDSSSSSIQLSLGEVELNHFKIFQKDQWKGQDFLVSMNKLELSADVFDLDYNLIKINSLEIEQPVFTQYDYTGFKPRDTPSAPEVKKEETHNGLQWNAENW